ncbi:MFS transporter [Paraburkholderia steynii]|uniref:MFS transporter n=1 Tax=Paraburkholderia steynii TaxID=1245441 RepID=A0A4R0XF11_9BURK|nr:MFS transporter [Paraburkholderia steynii]
MDGKICWRLVPLMILMYLANSLDRANIGYAALTMNKDLGITTAEFGIAASLFYLGYIACQIPSNLILHRIGARCWVATILLCWGTISSLTSLVPDTKWLYIARFVLGVFEAGLFPGMILYLTLWLPSRNRVLLMSMFVTAMPLSAVIGAPISTAIMTHTSVLGLSGWRTMLLLEGLPAVLLGILVFFYLPTSPRHSKWLKESELNELEEAIANEKAQGSGQQAETSVMSAVKDARVWALGIVYYGINAGILVLLFFLPQVIKTFEASFGVKYSMADVGLITAIPFGFAVVCMLLWARYLSKRGVAAWHIGVPLGIGALALASALMMPSPFLVMAAFAIAAAACFSCMAPFWQLPSRFLSGKAAAAGIGLISMLGIASGFTLPYAIGMIKDKTGSFAPAFTFIGLLMFIGALTAVALEVRRGPESDALSREGTS